MDSVYYEYKYGIDIVKRGHELVVRKDGKDLRSFHEISDDYAFTNAQSYARERQWEAERDEQKRPVRGTK